MSFFKTPLKDQDPLQSSITKAYRMDEAACVKTLLDTIDFSSDTQEDIQKLARELVVHVRKQEADKGGIEALMMHYDLSTEEGIILMCIAEALLRIPDKQTEDLLIQDKLTSAHWEEHLGTSESAFVNLATWGLALTGKVLRIDDKAGHIKSLWKGMIRRSGEPVIRQAVRESIKVMSQHFVLGRNIDEAVKRSVEFREQGYCFSFDMLGEVARTQADADRYFDAYKKAIKALGVASVPHDIILGPSISVKLSALYPRYEFARQETAIPFLTERLKDLSQCAKQSGMSLTVDAEEADRLEMSLIIIENVFSDPEFSEWEGLGLAVQAYQKRAYPVIETLIDLARRLRRRLQVRLTKGAYWDTEIKLSQVGGFDEYPVFTRKTSTDVAYLACAKLLLSAQDAIYPQFATHNAQSIAAILHMMDDVQSFDFEFQKLQGMGTSLHDQIIDKSRWGARCRVYAPVGSHEDLLPYLVRRLLENGANSSFVNRISDSSISIDEIIADPIAHTQSLKEIPNPNIPLPKAIYGEARLNSMGIDLSHHDALQVLEKSMMAADTKEWESAPFLSPIKSSDKAVPIYNPADKQVVGRCLEATTEDVDSALEKSVKAFQEWEDLGVEKRADILLKAAELLEAHRSELMVIAVREAGKVIPDALSEVREATDFCRYYAESARETMASKTLNGPTGESNTLRMHARGPMLCISPWNFPIAIFTGQIAAALVTGNTVIAKPAEQTPLVAASVVKIFYEAGVPRDVLQLLPGRGEVVGRALVEDPRVCGVIFTGSTETAKLIQKGLAERSGPIVPLIAETGGINAMIVDSTALPEQLIADVIASAFGSAGQRCSALRVLCIQEDIADDVITMLKGAMQEMVVGDPMHLFTDVGPVIDEEAAKRLELHAKDLEQTAKLIYRVPLPDNTQSGTFVAPQAYELSDLSALREEFFGPILHVLRYHRKDLDKVIDGINAFGYGLTFGIESRINKTVDYIQKRIKAGNIYVNRNMIGAVVGMQPFGGGRLSGTGPKAGGPHYLQRLCTESCLSIDTTAAGGNASLMVLRDQNE